MKYFSKKNKIFKAFTLAEILITLGIIGVVASLTIPTLVKNYQKQQTVEKLKKVYTTLSQAVKQSEIDNGPNIYWDWGDNITIRQSFDTHWGQYLKILKYCTTYSDCGYSSDRPWKTLANTDWIYIVAPSQTSFLLSDGIFATVRYKESTVVRKDIIVDLNGAKPPNVLGKDVFPFVLIPEKGFLPAAYNYSDSSINTRCSVGHAGDSCAAKIIRDGWQIKDDYPWN